MTYADYILLGFTRIEMNDSVEFNETGYSGFMLTKKVNDRVEVVTSSGTLDKPDMYIYKNVETGAVHRIPLTTDMVRDIFKNDEQ